MKLNYTVLFSFFFLFSSAYAEVVTLNVDSSKSEITWLGKKVAGQHDGFLKLSKGFVSLDDGRLVGGEFTLDMSTIENKDIKNPKYKNKIENHLKSDDFFNVSRFPIGTFKITSVTQDKNNTQITGMLTVKGISKEISFPAVINEDKGVYIANAELSIDRTLWDIKYNSGKFFDPANLGDKLIDDKIEIGLTIVAQASS